MMTTQTPPQPSPSDWLTRLRTSRGFPDSTHTNLEHFLSTSLPQSPPTPIPPHADVTSPHHIQPLQQHDVITNVLSDLFCFGIPNNNNNPSKPKTSRKQTNPKPCVSAKNSLVSSSPKVRTSRKQVTPKLCLSAKKAKLRECVEEEWEEDFRDFTETEVTVIDTSVVSWKFDKVLYRRNNVWRVGDVNTKRKDEGGDGENKNKKKKLKLCGQLKAWDKENGEKTKKKKKKKLKFVQLGDMLFFPSSRMLPKKTNLEQNDVPFRF